VPSLAEPSWRPTLAVALVIVGLVLGSNLLNAAIPVPVRDTEAEGRGTTTGSALQLQVGVRVSPPEGWTASRLDAKVFRLTRGNVVLDIVIEPFTGTNRQRYDKYKEEDLRPEFVPPVAILPSAPIQLGRHVGARGLYFGTLTGGRGSISGQVTAFSQAGMSVLFDAWRPTGVSQPRDIDLIEATLEVDAWR